MNILGDGRAIGVPVGVAVGNTIYFDIVSYTK